MNIALKLFGYGIETKEQPKFADIIPDEIVDGLVKHGDGSVDMLLPIDYLDKSKIHNIPKNVQQDLELFSPNEETRDNSGNGVSAYTKLFEPSSHFAKHNTEKWKCYTTCTDFLENTQHVIETLSHTPRQHIQPLFDEINGCFTFSEHGDELNKDNKIKHAHLPAEYNAIKCDADFMQKYGYIEWKKLAQLNNSKEFMQAMAIMQLVSPVLSFTIPLVLIVLPFFILKIQGVSITMTQYFDTLKSISKHHFIGKALNFSAKSVEGISYFAFIAVMYCIQMYQNYVSCTRFYRNIIQVNADLCKYKKYINATLQCMHFFRDTLNKTGAGSVYPKFVENMRIHFGVLNEINTMLDPITPFTYSIGKLVGLGHLLKCYYTLYNDESVNNAILYSFEFNGYLQNMCTLSQKWNAEILNFADFIVAKDEAKDKAHELQESNDGSNSSGGYEADDDTGEIVGEDGDTSISVSSATHMPRQHRPTKTRIEGQKYVFHDVRDCVMNSVDLSTNMIITGINASGKTTILKTTALNILFSQQVGCGLYKSACITPYTHIHSYLNIPDTSGRDSLFQAESRRCKQIIDEIMCGKNGRQISASVSNETAGGHNKTMHFCIFDELYSGTNPNDAVKSAYSFLKYLEEYPNVDFMLTTHYTSLCEKMNSHEKICNMQMEVVCLENGDECEPKFEYTYKLVDGICKLEGGVEILKMMDYPDEILRECV